MPMPQGRDLELTRKQLLEWFSARQPERENLAISALSGPGATGYSNDTLLFDLSWREGGRERSEGIVVRSTPSGKQTFPEYDLGLQFRVMQILGASDIPVPRVDSLEQDTSIIGDPFYVMERVAGEIPCDTPSYHAEGWLQQASPEQQNSVWWSGLEILSRIHKLDWRKLGFDFLDTPNPGMNPLTRQLDYYESFLRWAAEGRPQPTAEVALGWLRKNQPAVEHPGFCWGDSRLGNMIFRDHRCVCVLDWEMATMGDPVQDFAWWLFFDHHHGEGSDLMRLPGFPSREESIARYEEWTGRPVENLHYYEAFAAFRFSIILIRVISQIRSWGLLPQESDFETNNPCTRILARLLDLQQPGCAG